MPESSTSPEQTPTEGFRTARSVLLCGASVRSLAESAMAAGFRPICVDFFEDVDLTRLLSGDKGRFAGKLLSFADLPAIIRSVRRTVPMLWAGGLENHTDILRAIASHRPVIGASPGLIDRLRNPARLREWFTRAGLDVPRLATDATADTDRQWLRKPLAGSGGLGIHTASGSSAGTSQTAATLSSQEHEYVQEYIDGVPVSAVLCADQHGIELFGTSLQLIGWPSLGASDFLFCGNIGPCDPGKSVLQQVLTAARIVVEQTGLAGVFGIDFILRQGRAWFLEVNPRLTASHMLYERRGSRSGQSVNLVARHLAAFGWRPTYSRIARADAVNIENVGTPHSITKARLILWAQSEFKVPDNPETQIVKGLKLPFRVADVPKPGSVIPSGAPICSIHTSAATMHQLVESMRELSNAGSHAIISWSAVSRQLELLLDRFERNRQSA
jgi:predicted ATP-grasp superfamily ATP-dependent carboligase